MTTVVTNDTTSSPIVTSGINSSVLAAALGSSSTATNSQGSVTAASLSTQPDLAMPTGSLTSLPGGTTVTGQNSTVPLAGDNSSASTSVNKFGGYVKYVVLGIIVIMSIYFIHKNFGDIVGLADDVVKKVK